MYHISKHQSQVLDGTPKNNPCRFCSCRYLHRNKQLQITTVLCLPMTSQTHSVALFVRSQTIELASSARRSPGYPTTEARVSLTFLMKDGKIRKYFPWHFTQYSLTCSIRRPLLLLLLHFFFLLFSSSSSFFSNVANIFMQKGTDIHSLLLSSFHVLSWHR